MNEKTTQFSGKFNSEMFSQTTPLRSEEYTIKIRGKEETISFGQVIRYLSDLVRGGQRLNNEQINAILDIKVELNVFLDSQLNPDNEDVIGVKQTIQIIDYLLNSSNSNDKKNKNEDDGLRKVDTENVEYNLTVEMLRKKTLLGLVESWHTNDLDSIGEPRFALEKVIGEKLDELKGKMVNSSNPDQREEQNAQYESFKSLYEQVYGLIWFGILNSRSVNKKDLTAKEEELFEAAEINGALNLNAEFNRNPLVGAVGLDAEQFGPSMGIVQKIVYASYQEMKKTGRFSRGVAWTTEKTNQLIDFVCGLDSFDDERKSTVKTGRTSDLNINKELSQLPEEVQQIIKFFAKLKLSRDNLGYKAGVWHLGKGKAAFKFSDGGKGRPEGLLASIMYQVGKNSARENHAGCLAFVDLSQTEMVEAKKEQDAEVIRMGAEVDNFFDNWFHPTWKDISFQKFTPKHWDQDYPGLEDFFNQTESVVGQEDYTKARGAVLKIVELAVASPLITLSTNSQQLESVVRTAVKTFNTEIAKAMAYLGNNNLPKREDFSSDNEYAEAELRYNRFKPFHELIRASYQFYLLNLLIAIPGNPALFQNILTKARDSEYNILFNTGLKTILDTIKINTSLKGFYHDVVLKGFLEQKSIRRKWRDEDKMRNVFHRWRESKGEYLGHTLVNDPAADPSKRGIPQRQEMYLETPKMPYTPTDASEGKGWKSVFEAAA